MTVFYSSNAPVWLSDFLIDLCANKEMLDAVVLIV